LLALAVLALHVALASQQRQQGILPQLIVVVQVLIAQGDAVYALPHQFADSVFYQVRSPVIAKAAGELAQDAGALFHRAQQQRPGLGGDLSAIEPGHHVTRKMRCEREERLGTLCHSRSRFLFGPNCCVETQLCHEKRLFAIVR